jgi:C4-dicarboxylate transporter DctM subunit
MSIYLFGAFALLIAVAVPLAVAMGLAAMASIYFGNGLSLEIAAQRMISGMSSFTLIAIPLFVWAGSLMNRGGITQRLIDFAYSLIGSIRGGLAAVNVLTNAIFGGISGSAVADAGAIGRLLIPQMVKRGYTASYSAVVTATAATIALLIPPSIDLILYGVTARASIGMLFQWGLVAGIILSIMLIITAYITARRRGYPSEPRASGREVWRSFVGALPALMVPLVVIGGIRFGVFTPTEGSAVAVLASLIIGGLIYRDLTWSELVKSVTESVILMTTIMTVLAVAQIYSWATVTGGVTRQVEEFFAGFTNSRFVVLLIIVIFLLLIGTVLEGSAAILIFTPMLLPVVTAVGIDPLHFGLIMVAGMAFGLVTPPVGLTLLITTKIANIPLMSSIRDLVPWFGTCVLFLAGLTFLPLFFY